MDGLSANDDAAGLTWDACYGVDAVDQFQVVTSGGQAELGRALGGYINVVTKSGTNVPLTRIVYDYVRDQSGSMRPTRSPEHDAADEPDRRYGASAGRTARAQTRPSTSRTSNNGGSTSRVS